MINSEYKNNISEDFKQISENITIVIWKAKVIGNYEFEKTYISPVVDEILALPKGTVKNDRNKFFQHVKPEYIPEIQQKFQKAFVSPGTTELVEYEVIKANGEQAWLRSEGRCEIKNNELFIFGTTADITRQKEAEKALKTSKKEIKQQNIKLHEINAEKDKLFSIISHDLRSPFNVIIGFSKHLLKNHTKYDANRRENLIKPIINSATETYKLLESLLNWSKTKTGLMEFLPKQHSLKKILNNIIANKENVAKQKNIDLSFQTDEVSMVFADEYMLNTILRNLVSNAIKFTNKNGNITIKATENDKNTIISVIDNGIGINKKEQEKLFDISEKTTTKGTENEKGTGLGLILCKEFTEKHGGQIRLDSETGKGSTFTVFIPKTKQ